MKKIKGLPAGAEVPKPDIIFDDVEFPPAVQYEIRPAYKKKVCFSIPSYREIKPFLQPE